jgi:hypothetical protein
MTQTTSPKTTDLFAAAHAALCAGRWSEARAALDLLGDRQDNRDLLPDASAYRVPALVAQLIQDRIDLVNANADGH